MPIGDICVRDVVIASRDTTARAAAKLMAENHVGNIVVVEDVGGRKIPVGIITDRDIILKCGGRRPGCGRLYAG